MSAGDSAACLRQLVQQMFERQAIIIARNSWLMGHVDHAPSYGAWKQTFIFLYTVSKKRPTFDLL